MKRERCSAELIRLYDRGQYVCQVPPVPTTRWDRWDWIQWINSHGRWLPRRIEC